MKHPLNWLAYWSIVDVNRPLHPFGNINAPLHTLTQALDVLEQVRSKYPDNEWSINSCGMNGDIYKGMELSDIQNPHERHWIAQVVADMDSGMTEQQILDKHYADRVELRGRQAA
jgi:hypothetical protein